MSDLEKRFPDGSLVRVHLYHEAPSYWINDAYVRMHIAEPEYVVLTPRRADVFTGQVVVEALGGEAVYKMTTIMVDGIECTAWISGRVS